MPYPITDSFLVMCSRFYSISRGDEATAAAVAAAPAAVAAAPEDALAGTTGAGAAVPDEPAGPLPPCRLEFGSESRYGGGGGGWPALSSSACRSCSCRR